MNRMVVGTCFSLQKEHDTALKFFRRSIQLDPHCAYAHTLAAHEHVANEVLLVCVTINQYGCMC
jgi:Tfp pilus assembly protein PilF